MGTVQVKQTPNSSKDCDFIRQEFFKACKADNDLRNSNVAQDQLLRTAAIPGFIIIQSAAELAGCDIKDIINKFEN